MKPQNSQNQPATQTSILQELDNLIASLESAQELMDLRKSETLIEIGMGVDAIREPVMQGRSPDSQMLQKVAIGRLELGIFLEKACKLREELHESGANIGAVKLAISHFKCLLFRKRSEEIIEGIQHNIARLLEISPEIKIIYRDIACR